MSVESQDVFASGGRFVNTGSTAVIDSLLGFVMSNPTVGLLDFGNVVVCRNYLTNDIVKVISGGASGHEPAHAGFVGKGMLTAAVQGEVFCSPIMSDILKTIREVSHRQDSDVLVIVQNTTADRLNFGLAVERARIQGIGVKMLVVAEEYYTVDERRGKRGLCGIVLINKIAGAMAESGCSMGDIYSFCQRAHSNMTSILLSLQNCTSPGLSACICSKSMGDNEMEIGSGLHGEVGLKRMRKLPVADACELLIDEISENFVLNSTTPVVVLINNLGNNLQMEELIFVKEFIGQLQDLGVPIARVYRGHFLTALDMRGFSATIMKVFDPKVLDYLNASCDAPAWGGTNTSEVPKDVQVRLPARAKEVKRLTRPGPRLSQEQANIVLLAVQFACDALISCERQLNTIDAESGSGNVGSKMKRGAAMVLAEAKKKTLTFENPRRFFQSLSIITEKLIGGTLGFLYSILFDAAANTFRQLSADDHLDACTWFCCLRDASDVLKRYGNVEFGYGTMYDPLYACVTIMEDALQNGITSLDGFALGVAAAEDAAKQTRQPSKRFPDPGAHVVGIWLRAVLEGLKMKCE